jgi:hypothetical protein
MSSKITDKYIAVTQGDSFILPITFTGLNISGAFIRMQVRTKDEKASLLIDECVSNHLNPKEGKTCIRLKPEQTNIPVGVYETDIELTMPNGDKKTFYPAKVGTVAQFRVTKQITKEQ